MSEPALCEHQLENSNNCATTDLPAPEKLLSAPEETLDKPSDLLDQSTPDKEVVTENDEIDAGTKLISGKKRSITESTLTIESINSVSSFGRPTMKRTADPVPDDDDLLSSILVGRSSVFKMKPTPPVEVASMKRARSAPRATATKRKLLMDDSMVLHGDTIREQLTNTEDIRRTRKKAPCTRPEISLIQRNFLKDEIFSEPIFTGMSGDLACLHSEPYDLSSIRISEGEENHASSELAKISECSARPNITEGGIEECYVPVMHGNDEQAQSAAMPNQNDTQQGDYSDLNAQQDSYAADGVPQLVQQEPLDGITEMEIDRDNVEVAGVTSDMIVGELTNTIDGSMLDNATCLPPDQNISTQPGEDAFKLDMINVSDDKGAHPTEVLEHGVESIIAAETESKATDELLLEESKANTSVGDGIADCPVPIENGTDFLGTLQTSEPVNDTHNSYETEHGKGGVADEAQIEGELLDNDDKDTIPKDNRAEYEDVAVANDTEFLNVDDNELGDDDDNDDGMPRGGDASRLLENSGWSSRTRAVAKYLQNLFEDDVVHGDKILSMDGLLARKTRKEASRMFFETLVLKSKDYIHVEQVKPFDNICIRSRVKLMKSDF